MKKPELLLPAGSRAALEGAIEGGADAIYMGSSKFNARMRAENFSHEDMLSAIRLSKAYGIKTYITLNTRLYDTELREALSLCSDLYEAGADALIVADMGIAALIKKHIPDLELHASTQLSGHSVSDASALFDAGFSRMVCHREIREDALFDLCSRSPIEIEMFIHGAYCVSFSGQCLMSAVMGGRSGNRGECAQPCRQPYIKEGCKAGGKDYPISLKDMCLAGHIRDIMKTGVASLKIEGRQKSAEYVFGVARIYRRLIDEERNATADEIEYLRSIFSRDGFSDGYFTGDLRSMRGVRTYEDYLKMDKSKFEGLKRKEPVDITLKAKAGEKAAFTIASKHKSYTAVGETVAAAGDIAPISEEGALKNSSRLGSTPFILGSFRFETDGNAALTLSAVNALRREACEGILDTLRKKISLENETAVKGKKPKREKTVYTAEFLSAQQITPLCEEFFDKIYLPYGYHNEKYHISLPPYLPDSESDKVFEGIRNKSVLCHTTGQMARASRVAKEVAGSFRLNIFNSAAAEYFTGFSPAFLTVSPEMKRAQIRDLSSSAPIACTVYGRLPLMLLARCAISDGDCKKKNKKELCASSVTDRHGVRFPLYGMGDCTNIICNSVPIYMADKTDELKKAGITHFHFIFTDERAEECERIIKAYMDHTPPAEGENIRRIN